MEATGLALEHWSLLEKWHMTVKSKAFNGCSFSLPPSSLSSLSSLPHLVGIKKSKHLLCGRSFFPGSGGGDVPGGGRAICSWMMRQVLKVSTAWLVFTADKIVTWYSIMAPQSHYFGHRPARGWLSGFSLWWPMYLQLLVLMLATLWYMQHLQAI